MEYEMCGVGCDGEGQGYGGGGSHIANTSHIMDHTPKSSRGQDQKSEITDPPSGFRLYPVTLEQRSEHQEAPPSVAFHQVPRQDL